MGDNSINLWIVILSIGIATFFIRFSFIWLLGNRKINSTIQNLLQFVPPAVLAALITPSFLLTPEAQFSIANQRMWAGFFAALVAWKTRNVIFTIASGLFCLWIFSLL
ncbi:MAG: hypothetical protein C0619_09300 [Desulfuromonas sp.]|nr:MAG: hypothetical protein C0619_09300 [Desulfuromonas sp.]